MDKIQFPGMKYILATIREFSNSISRFDPRSPSETLHVRKRVEQFLRALKTLDDQSADNFSYSLLSTRELISAPHESPWKRYLLGEKLSDTETYVSEHRTELQNLLLSSGEDPVPLGNVSYNLTDILRELNLPSDEAGSLFLEKVKNTFIEDIRTSLLIPQIGISSEHSIKSQQFQLDRKSDYYNRAVPDVHDTLILAEPKKDKQHIGVSLEKGISVNEERPGNLRQLIRLLERIREQASHYATNLVALLDVYLDITRRQAEAEEKLRVKRLNTNETLVYRALGKLNAEEVVEYLSRVPLYMNLNTSRETGDFGTVIIPKFNDHALNEGFQKLWYWIIEQILLSQ